MADQQRSNAYGANTTRAGVTGANNQYIGSTAQGINGAPEVMKYADRAQYNNPYLGQNADRAASAGKNAYAGPNKYLEGASDSASNDMTRSFNKTVVPQFDRMMQQSGSFGNSGVQEMQGEAYNDLGKNIGNMANSMRMQDYTTQQGLAENDLNRTTQNNQFNSGLSSADLSRNMAGGFAQNSANTGMVMDAAMFDAGNNFQGQQFNASLGQNDLGRNAGLAQNAGQFNAGAMNTNSMFNAGAGNQASMFNAGQGNNLNQFNASAGNNTIQNYLTRQQNQGQFDATLGTNNRQFDANLANNRYQFDTNSGNQVDQFYQNLDRGIWNDNMGWADRGFNNAMNLTNNMMGVNQTGVGATTGAQNTDLNYYTQFLNNANATGGLGGTATQQYDAQGNPILGAIGGWNAFAPNRP
jgi:hypothetical protein